MYFCFLVHKEIKRDRSSWMNCKRPSVSRPPLLCHHHKFLNMHCSQYVLLRHSEGKECKSLTKQSSLNNIPSPLCVPGQRITLRWHCHQSILENTWKRGSISISKANISHGLLEPTVFGVGDGGCKLGGGQSGKCPPVIGHQGFHCCSSVTWVEVVCTHRERIKRDTNRPSSEMRALLLAAGSD